MSLVSKTAPIGIDIPVDKIQRALYTDLVTNGPWLSYESYHRAYENDHEEGIRPEVFTTNNDYKEVFMDDAFNVTSFFIVDQDRLINNGEEFRSDISIIFQVQLDKLLPLVLHRADEEFNNQVSNVLSNLGYGYELLGMEQGIDNVFAEFDQDQIKYEDLQPYYVVRFNLSVPYSYDCSRIFLNASCTLSVNVTSTPPSTIGASDATATANIMGGQGGISYLWDDPAAQTAQVATGLTAGTYSVIVTDDIVLGCTASDSIIITNPAFNFANCLDFDGVNDKVSHPSIQIGVSQNFALSIWLYPSVQSGDILISGASNAFLFYNTTTNLVIAMDGSQSNFTFPVFTPNVWQHLFIFRDTDDVLHIMRDGVESTTGGLSNTGSMILNRIGFYEAGPSLAFFGRVDEYALKLGTAGTLADGVLIYNSGAGGDFDTIIGSSNFYFKLNETGTDTITVDENGTHDATLTNFPASGMWIDHDAP